VSTPVRVAAFAAALVVVFVAALGLGRAVGPLDVEPEATHAETEEHADEPSDEHGEGHGEGQDTDPVVGLGASQDGYTLSLLGDRQQPGRRLLEFTVTGPEGRPVTSYDEQHERDLHLVVVRRDLTGFQHLHPDLDTATGTWSTPVDLDPGGWRVIADFAPAGLDPLVLGTDLLVPGRLELAPEPEETRIAVRGPYQAVLNGDVGVGESELTLTLSKHGRPITDLQPYLGSYGHLIALRAGDLGYLHVHPDEETGPGPDLVFHTSFPSADTFRLFLDFQHDGVVRTMAFTVEVGDGHGHEH
jgi:hypothetical protein